MERLVLLLGMVWMFAADVPSVLAAEPPTAPVRHVVILQAVPRAPALLAHEQAFVATLRSALSDPVAFHNEYVELDGDRSVEAELVSYLGAKYARTKIDLVAVVSSPALRFAVRHRTRLFAGAPVVFSAVDRSAATDIPLDARISGVWLSMDWHGTLDAARRLQPDAERAVVINGASAADNVWADAARSQLARLNPPIEIVYIERLSIESVTRRLTALPPRSIVLLGTFLSDANEQRFFAPEVAGRISAASSAPVYGLNESHVGHGVVGGHVISFELQGRRAAEIAVRMLRGEEPPPIEGGTNLYRFDGRQLRRWSLDARRLPPGSHVDFDEATLWRAYRGYIAAAVFIVAMQAWLIALLLVNRAQRRRAQRRLADQLRFETLISDLLASHLTLSTAGVASQVQRALALIGSDLDADRMVLAELDESRHGVAVAYTWTREGVSPLPSTIESSTFPWISARIAAGHVAVVSPARPLPREAQTDRLAMITHATRSLLAVPLVLENAVVGALSCATVRGEREWPDALIERLRLLAEVFASILARHRAEAAARASEARFLQQREELTHALRVNTLGELSASLAHELNQPLSAILLNASALRTLISRGEIAQPVLGEALSDIAADAKRAGDIMSRLRALARKEHVFQAGLSVDALVDDVAGLLHQEFVRRGIVVTRIKAPDMPPVSGDPIQLQQIVLNLLVNASEALENSECGIRELTIQTSNPAPRLVELAVRDSAVGGKDVDLERMFERFVTTKPGGLGMGLAISRSIAEAHGGRIYAKANSDRGLTVYVELLAEV